MNKYIKELLFIITICLLVTGCYSSEERALAKQYEKQGKEYAINYVKEKYGFNAKVKSAKTIRSCNAVWGCFDSSPSGTVEVMLKANKKTFSVNVMGLDEDNIKMADNYQHEEIKKDLINYFKDNIPLDLYQYNIDDIELITEYYDNNLEDMLQYIGNVELYYIGDNNLSMLDLYRIENFWKNDCTLKLINFKSQEKYEKYKNVNFEDLSLISEEMKNIYIDNKIKIKNGQKEFSQIDNITNYNDKIYVYAHKDNSYHTISLSKIDVNNYRELYTELKDRKIVQVADAYSILSSSSVLYIYFPKDIVNAKDSDKIFFVNECNVNQEKKYFIDKYYGLNSKMKMGTDGNYYINLNNFSYCDVNSEVTFSLIKIS